MTNRSPEMADPAAEASMQARKLFLELCSAVPNAEKIIESHFGDLYKINSLEAGLFVGWAGRFSTALRGAYLHGSTVFGAVVLDRDELSAKLAAENVDQATTRLHEFITSVLHIQPVFAAEMEQEYRETAAIFNRYNATADFEQFKSEYAVLCGNGSTLMLGEGHPAAMRAFLAGLYWGGEARDPDMYYYGKEKNAAIEEYITKTVEHEASHFNFVQEATRAIGRLDLAPYMTVRLLSGENGGLSFAPACGDNLVYTELFAGRLSQEEFDGYRSIAYQDPHHGRSNGDELILDAMRGYPAS